MSKIFKLGVIGSPIDHSLSPFIHSRFARQEGINLDYQAYKVDDLSFNGFIDDFFINPNAKGLNVTLPLKKLAAELHGNISNEAKHINAVNTIIKLNNKYDLETTDGIGFMEDLKSKNIDVFNKNILIIGAGAAVESILYKLMQGKPKKISVSNRSSDKAQKLIKKYTDDGNIETALDKTQTYDIVINGSSAGLTGAFRAPENLEASTRTVFYDLNYSLDSTPFCAWATDYSPIVFDGTGMLVNQAAHSFNLWFGVFPATEEVLEDIKSLKE